MNNATKDSPIRDYPDPPDIDGECRRDDITKQLYSTDASIYKVHPSYVFIPVNQDDVKTITRWAYRNEISLIPRGGGTSLSGQSIGRGAIVDYSRHLNEIKSFNQDEQTVTVEPGVILDHLNDELSEHGLQFGPDVATSNRATIGGMIGNDSAGAHSIKFGNTSGHVKSLTCQLANGDVVTFEPIPLRDNQYSEVSSDKVQSLREKIPSLLKEHEEQIRSVYPDIKRNVSGYGLDRFLDQLDNGYLDFTQLICGSEGTLATVLEAELNLVQAPTNKALVVMNCDSLEEAMKVNQRAIELDPYAVEFLDEMILELGQESLEISRHMDWLEGDPRAVVIVELAEFPDEPNLSEQIMSFQKEFQNGQFNDRLKVLQDPEEQKSVWKVRKSGLPLLLGISGDDKPTTFVEDTAVDPDKLVGYVRDFQNLVEDHDTKAAFYGHSSVGCLHIRPLVNLKTSDGVQNMRKLAADAVDLVERYDGAISGEHGDGRARSEWLEDFYGTQVVELFNRIKDIFDPRGIFNPGNIVNPQPMHENLRFGDDYSTKEWKTVQDFGQQGGYTELVELCNGSGVCRKEDSGTMCPSFMATKDEMDSTRGRANALRGILDGDLDPEALTDGRLGEVMDLCISCKACKSECPSNVDMAPLKEEVQHQINEEQGVSLRDQFFGYIGRMARASEPIQPVPNWIQQIPGSEPILKSLLGIAPERELPHFSSDPLSLDDYPSTVTDQSEPVVLLPDTFNTYIEPDVARSSIRLLENLGFDPIVPDLPCCGRPMMSKGLLQEAKTQARKTINALEDVIEKGVPIVGLEPSCASAYTDDYPRYLPGKKAKKLAQQTSLFTDFLSDHRERINKLTDEIEDPVVLHGHCHQKALYGTDGTLSIIEQLTESSSYEIDSGCCGMAGSFGYEEEHYQVSKAMAERKLVPAIQGSEDSATIVAPGISCRQQIRHFTDRSVSHPVQVLAEQVDPENGG